MYVHISYLKSKFNKMYFSNHVFFKRRRLRAKVKTVLNRYSTSMSLATKIKNFSRGYREL